MKQKVYLSRSLFCLLLLGTVGLGAQFQMTELPLTDLSAFQASQSNWQTVGAVEAPFGKEKTLETRKGSGILVNLPDARNKAQIFTRFEHGDIDLDLEVMMPRGSNSGIYLQGRYEIQLLDSWGKQRPTFGDMGGIYQRWDPTQPEGERGYEGTAPLVNAAKAPGLWQRLRISFQAPRFDAQGQKVENARIIFVELNGVMIHQNVELTGPTRGPYVGGGEEAALGPLVIQGDHGPVAFRNFKYRSFDGEPVVLTDLNYKVYRENISTIEDWENAQADKTGTEQLITWNAAQADNDFALVFDGYLEVPEAGDYLFSLACQGNARLWIEGEPQLNVYSNTTRDMVSLPKGQVPIRLLYYKTEVWRQAQLGLSVEGRDFRPVDLHYKSSALANNPTDPIFERVGGRARLLRSFVDFKMPAMEQSKKITNALNVGDPTGLHYTFDLNQGSLVQVWRGDFLNMTPMWYNRGNGVSRALGVRELLTADIQLLQKTNGRLPLTFAEGQYRFRSYKVDENNRPTFFYEAYGLPFKDQMLPTDDGKSLLRRLSTTGKPKGDLFFCLATGENLSQVDKQHYRVADRYLLRTDASAKIEDMPDGRKALLVPVKEGEVIEYTIVW